MCGTGLTVIKRLKKLVLVVEAFGWTDSSVSHNGHFVEAPGNNAGAVAV